MFSVQICILSRRVFCTDLYTEQTCFLYRSVYWEDVFSVQICILSRRVMFLLMVLDCFISGTLEVHEVLKKIFLKILRNKRRNIIVKLHYLSFNNGHCWQFCTKLFSSCMPGSLDCPFLIAPSVFSNVYFFLSWTQFYKGSYPRTLRSKHVAGLKYAVLHII
jgi:hypothetical protein